MAAPTLTLRLTPPAGYSSPTAVTIPLNSYQFTNQNTLQVNMAFAGSSPLLLSTLVRGQQYGTAVLTQRDATGQPVNVWSLNIVYVSSDSISATNGSLPSENLKFVFSSSTQTLAPLLLSANPSTSSVGSSAPQSGSATVSLRNTPTSSVFTMSTAAMADSVQPTDPMRSAAELLFVASSPKGDLNSDNSLFRFNDWVIPSANWSAS